MITKELSYFPNFSPEAKVWIFMSDTEFNNEQKEFISSTVKAFLQNWNAHGNALNGDYEILHNRFLIVSVDESSAHASGCSIDSLTHIIKKIESELDLSMTNRMLVAYKNEEKEVNVLSLKDFKDKIKDSSTSGWKVYDNSLYNLSDFRRKWLLPIQESWASRFM